MSALKLQSPDATRYGSKRRIRGHVPPVRVRALAQPRRRPRRGLGVISVRCGYSSRLPGPDPMGGIRVSSPARLNHRFMLPPIIPSLPFPRPPLSSAPTPVWGDFGDMRVHVPLLQPKSRKRLTSPMRKSDPAMTTGVRPRDSARARRTALRVSGSRKISPPKGGAAAASSSGVAERL
jgi:hypothetical protein